MSHTTPHDKQVQVIFICTDAVQVVDFFELVEIILHLHIETHQLPRSRVIDAGMDFWLNEAMLLQVLVGLNSSLLDDPGFVQIDRLLYHVDLDKPSRPDCLVRNRAELLPMQAVHISDVPQPVGQGGGVIVVSHRGIDSAAVVVTTENDMLNLKNAHGILDHTHCRGVCVVDQVRNVPMNKKAAGRETADAARCYSAVAAAYP